MKLDGDVGVSCFVACEAVWEDVSGVYALSISLFLPHLPLIPQSQQKKMCSLEFKGLLGDVGVEFGGVVGGRPQIALDADDVHQELGTAIDRALEAEDMLLGAYTAPVFQSCDALSDPANAFAPHRVAWPTAVRENTLLSGPDPQRDAECNYRFSVTLDPDASTGDAVTVECDTAGLASFSLDGTPEDLFWSKKEALFGGAGGEGEELLEAMEKDTKGLTPPGWSAPLLVDVSRDAPLCGAAVGQEKVEEETTSTMRNATKYFTKQVDEAQLVAEGKMSAVAQAKRNEANKTKPHQINTASALKDACDAEVDSFNYDLLECTDNDGASVPHRSDWVNTTLLDVSEFSSIVPHPAVSYPFELDGFQKQAIARLEMNENVFVAAHTSAGKTVVAEYAIGLAKSRGTRVLYTSPIKTLSNQKYRDFKQKFGDDVGILTGDVQLNATASCLVMTTEILRSALYQRHNAAMSSITGLADTHRADMLNDVEYVIFDEVHYVNDANRGYVWEEVIILLPKTVKLVMLSATVPNIHVFADWVGRTRQARVNVVSTLKRPVPLQHAILCNDKEFPLVEGKRFLGEGLKAFAVQAQLAGAHAGKFNSMDARMKNEAREWRNMIRYLSKKQRLPMIVFTFSKQRIDFLSEHISTMNFTSKKEKAAIEAFLRQGMARLKGSDKSIPQVQKIFRLLRNGVAVHHAGLMPIIKEVVEQLFCQGFIRVLFATETFAMGVNAPARSVIFADSHKFDGSTNGKRVLQPGEYTQMAGRAGRRGLDTVGYVYIYGTVHARNSAGSGFVGNIPPEHTLKTMMTGQPVELVSKFRLTNAMVLNCLMSTAWANVNGEATQDTASVSFISHLLRNSFAEARANKYYPVYKALQKKYEDEATLCTEKMALARGEHCERLMDIYLAVRDFVHCSRSLAGTLVIDTKEAQKHLPFGTVVVVETAPMSFALGYVLRMHKVDEMNCFILTHNEDDETFVDTTGRAYDVSRVLVPRALSDASCGEIVEVTMKRNKIIAVLDQKHNVATAAVAAANATSSVDARRAAPPMMQLKKDDDDDFFSGKKGKGKKDTKKPAAAAAPLPARPAAPSGPSLPPPSLINDKAKQKEMAEQLRTILDAGINVKDDVVRMRQGTLEGIDLEAGFVECAEAVEDFGAINGEDMRLAHERFNAEKRSSIYANMSSDDSLFLMPEFKGRLHILEVLGMVQPANYGAEVDAYDVLPKGRCASVFASMDAVLATEVLYDGVFDDLTPAEIAAALSCFMYVFFFEISVIFAFFAFFAEFGQKSKPSTLPYPILPTPHSCNERVYDGDEVELPAELLPMKERLLAIESGLEQLSEGWYGFCWLFSSILV